MVSVLATIPSGNLVPCSGDGWFGIIVIWCNLWWWRRCFRWDIHICCVLVLIFVLLKTSTKINRITQQISEIYTVVMGDLVRLWFGVIGGGGLCFNGGMDIPSRLCIAYVWRYGSREIRPYLTGAIYLVWCTTCDVVVVGSGGGVRVCGEWTERYIGI